MKVRFGMMNLMEMALISITTAIELILRTMVRTKWCILPMVIFTEENGIRMSLKVSECMSMRMEPYMKESLRKEWKRGMEHSIIIIMTSLRAFGSKTNEWDVAFIRSISTDIVAFWQTICAVPTTISLKEIGMMITVYPFSILTFMKVMKNYWRESIIRSLNQRWESTCWPSSYGWLLCSFYISLSLYIPTKSEWICSLLKASMLYSVNFCSFPV